MAEITKFEELVGGALKKFDEQSAIITAQAAEIASLKGSIETLQSIVPAQAGFVQRHRGVEIPWDSKEAAGEFTRFARAIALKDQATIKSMAEGTDADGGYLVPVEFKPTLLRIIEQYGQIRQVAQIVPMARDEMQWPVYSGGWNDENGAVSTPVYWVDENATITQTWPQFSNVTMTCKKLAALIPTSGELLQDSVIPIANLISTLVGEYLAKEEDRVGFVGRVANGDKFDGALTSAGNVITGATTDAKDIIADDLLDMINATPLSVQGGAEFYMSRSMFHVLRKLKDKNDNYIFNPVLGPSNQISQNGPGQIWGYPVRLIEAFPAYTGAPSASTRYILFGNMRNFYFADRMQLSVASTDIVGFASFQTHFRFVERIGMKLPLPATLTAWRTAAA